MYSKQEFTDHANQLGKGYYTDRSLQAKYLDAAWQVYQHASQPTMARIPRADPLFSVSAEAGDTHVICTYRLMPGGTLDGRWIFHGSTTLGKEILTPRSASGKITGSYAVDGTNPNGSKYSGTCEVVAKGLGYDFTWTLGRTWTGQGLQVRDLDMSAIPVTIMGRLARKVVAQKDSWKLAKNWDVSDPKYWNNDSPAITKNLKLLFGTMNQDPDPAGAILNSGMWSLLANDAWLLGGVHARTEFLVASPLSWINLWDNNHDSMTVTAREVVGLKACGYKFERGGSTIVTAGPDPDLSTSISPTLLSYAKALKIYFNGSKDFSGYTYLTVDKAKLEKDLYKWLPWDVTLYHLVSAARLSKYDSKVKGKLNWSGANLSASTGAFRTALADADLTAANLSYADLSGLDLSKATLKMSDLEAANVTGATMPPADKISPARTVGIVGMSSELKSKIKPVEP